jgi:cytochrome c biogenesis protein CcmG/thiol:disulfide interchange protein DsbE
MRRLVYIVPAMAFFIIAAFLAAGLWQSGKHAPDELPSMLVNQPVPRDVLPALAGSHGFAPADFAKGHVTVLNMFASWCVPCRAEAPGLAAIKGMNGVALYGIAWKDSAKNAQAFLAQVGDPYNRIDLDADGRAGIDWGITGVPETFVIDGTGVVRLRYAGPLVGDALANIVLPAIERARHDG